MAATITESAEDTAAYREMVAVIGWAPDGGTDLMCGWCRRRPATVPDHQPPLALFGSLDEWKRKGGFLFPSCSPCKKTQGRDVDTPTGSWAITTTHNINITRTEYAETLANYKLRQAGQAPAVKGARRRTLPQEPAKDAAPAETSGRG